MRLRFNGAQGQKKGGCPVCGARRVSNNGVIYTKTYILPSGQSKTFTTGRIYDVSEADGKFLLSYVFTKDSKTMPSFEKL